MVEVLHLMEEEAKVALYLMEEEVAVMVEVLLHSKEEEVEAVEVMELYIK